MTDLLPSVGRRYAVDFVAFKVELYFSSVTSLTYTPIGADGVRGKPETVTIRAEAIGVDLFLVTWQEHDKTTVVHIEDYAKYTIITNITNTDNSFQQFHGSFTLISKTYSKDIRPLFRDNDITCMAARGVQLSDPTWMINPVHAQKVYSKISSGAMPPDGAWPPERVAIFKQWMDDGYLP
jgi:hypothetical protein